MKNNYDTDKLLKRALTSAEEPDRELIEHTKYKLMKRETTNLKKYKTLKRSSIAVAAVIAIALMSGTAFATNMFGLQDVILREKTEIFVPEEQEDGTFVEKTEEVDIMSLQGYVGSNEYEAFVEWQEFEDSYDQDCAILDSVGNSDIGLSITYRMYGAYTQEMADKIDEITAKYGLLLHGDSAVYDGKELMDVVANGNFIGDTNTCHGGYVYGDGTFQFDADIGVNNSADLWEGISCIHAYDPDDTSPEEFYNADNGVGGGVEIYLPIEGTAKDAVVADFSSGELKFVPYEGDLDALDSIINDDDEVEDDYIGFQFRYCKKGYFDDVALNIRNIDDYTQWEYKTACGVSVTLAQSSYKSLIIADLEDAFVAVNILDEHNDLSASELEEFADTLDLTLLK